MIDAALGTIRSNSLKVLGELRPLDLEAKGILPGYYNPFPTSDPSKGPAVGYLVTLE